MIADDVVAHPAKGQAIGFGISDKQGIDIRPEVNADATAFLVANQASAKLVCLAGSAVPLASASHASQRAKEPGVLDQPRTSQRLPVHGARCRDPIFDGCWR